MVVDVLSKADVDRYSYKRLFRISQNSQQSTCAGVFSNKVAYLTPVILLKRDSSSCFPVNFEKFHIFCIEYLQKNASVCIETRIKQSHKETYIKTQINLELVFFT